LPASCCSTELATSTGTDQLRSRAAQRQTADLNHHAAFGELSAAVRGHASQALRWRWLEPSYARTVPRARRYGLKEQMVVERLGGLLEAGDFALLKQQEIGLHAAGGAAAHAIAALTHHPPRRAPDACVRRAVSVMLAASLTAGRSLAGLPAPSARAAR
jgi:hypothetical protein